jgi:hypothetical protein
MVPESRNAIQVAESKEFELFHRRIRPLGVALQKISSWR